MFMCKAGRINLSCTRSSILHTQIARICLLFQDIFSNTPMDWTRVAPSPAPIHPKKESTPHTAHKTCSSTHKQDMGQLWSSQQQVWGTQDLASRSVRTDQGEHFNILRRNKKISQLSITSKALLAKLRQRVLIHPEQMICLHIKHTKNINLVMFNR